MDRTVSEVCRIITGEIGRNREGSGGEISAR
jgi:hypothetical protein